MIGRLGSVLRASTLLRSLLLVVVVGLVLLLVTDSLSSYRNLQLANVAYYFCVLAGLTVLAGSSGQISLGHGAFMAVGAYTVAKLGSAGWSVFPELVAAVLATLLVGIPVGMAASRLRGPYLAGATLAFAVGLPALADKFPTVPRRRERAGHQPADPTGSLGTNFPLERWEAWIACAGALVVLVRVLQRDPQRHRPLDARGTRRRDRGVAGRAAHRALADAGVRAQRTAAAGSAAGCWRW